MGALILFCNIWARTASHWRMKVRSWGAKFCALTNDIVSYFNATGLFVESETFIIPSHPIYISRIYVSNIASRDFDSVSMATENSVVSLRETPFNRRSDVDKKRLKDMGPERPDLKMQQQSIDRGRTYTRSFSSSLYANRSWLAGCSVSDAFFLFSLPVVPKSWDWNNLDCNGDEGSKALQR